VAGAVEAAGTDEVAISPASQPSPGGGGGGGGQATTLDCGDTNLSAPRKHAWELATLAPFPSSSSSSSLPPSPPPRLPLSPLGPLSAHCMSISAAPSRRVSPNSSVTRAIVQDSRFVSAVVLTRCAVVESLVGLPQGAWPGLQRGVDLACLPYLVYSTLPTSHGRQFQIVKARRFTGTTRVTW